MIGGQLAMFSNNAAYAHQIGAAYMGPPVLSHQAGMAAPSFGRQGYAGQDMGPIEFSSAGGGGAGMIGGAGAALPGMAAGLSLAGGFGMLGSAGRMLDPISAIGGGFARGAAAGGLSGGLMGAAGPAALLYGGYKAAEHIGGQVYQGAQNVSNVGQMAQQYMGPQYGEQGVRPGGKMGRGQIKEIVDTLHEVAGENTMASMKDLQGLMDRFGQMGMLTGAGSPAQFKQKFRGLVSQVTNIAKMLGTTLEDAAPMLAQFQQMGLWSAQDVMGGAAAMQTVGAAQRPALMQSMMSGAQRSHAMGGSMAAGATTGRNQFMNVSAAVREGIMSNEAIQEFTGGTGGIEGQRMVAERMTQAMQMATQTPVGRMTMAALGETKDGKFTGRIDQDMMDRMQRGEISIGELQQIGQRKARSRQGKASFTWRQEQIGQQMMAQGGMGLMTQMFQKGLEKAGFGGESEDIQGLMLQKLYGLQRRDAGMIQQMMRELPAVQERKGRREIDALNDVFQRADEAQNKSWEGFKQSMSHAFEETIDRPIQEFAEGLTTRANEQIDRLTDTIWGRTRRMNISQKERISMLAEGARGGVGMLDKPEMNRLMVGGAAAGMETGFIERMRRGGGGLGGAAAGFGSAALKSMTGIETGIGTRAEALTKMGAQVSVGAEEAMPAGATLVWKQGGAAGWIREESERQTITRAHARARNPAKLFKMDDKNKELLGRVKAAYAKVSNTATLAAELADYKKGEGKDPAAYMNKLLKMVRSQDEGAFKELRELKGGGEETDRDALAVVQAGGDVGAGIEAEFKRVAGDGPSVWDLAGDSKLLGERRTELEGKMTEALTGGAPGMLERLAGPAISALAPVPGAGILGGIVGAFTAVSGMGAEGMDISETEVAAAMSGPGGQAFANWLANPTDETEAAFAKARRGNDKLQEIYLQFGRMGDSEQATKFKQSAIEMAQLRKAKAYTTSWREGRKSAKAEKARLGDLDIDEGIKEEFSELLDKYQDVSDVTTSAAAAQAAEDLAGRLTSKQRKQIRKSGDLGRHLSRTGGVGALGGGDVSEAKFRKRLTEEGLQGLFALAGTEAGEKVGLGSKRISGIMEDKEISKFEMIEIKEALSELARNVGAQDTTTRGTTQERMAAELTKFAGANEKFVLAVSAAMPHLSDITKGDLTKAAQRLSDLAKDKKPGTEGEGDPG